MAGQSNYMSFGRILALFITGVAVCALMVFSPRIIRYLKSHSNASMTRASSSPPPDPLAEQRVELEEAIVAAGTPLSQSSEPQTMDFDAEKGRFWALYKQRKLEFKNIELTKAWAHIQSDVDSGIATLQKIAELDGKHVFAEAAEAANHDESLKSALLLAAHFTEESQAIKSLFNTERDLDASIASLQEVVNDLTRNTLSPQVSVKYLPSWEGTYSHDMLIIKNTSGAEIERASIIVSVKMNDATFTHVHYVNHWAKDSTVHTYYPYSATDYAQAQTGEHPEHVEVTVFQETGTSHTSYELTPDEWDHIVQSYCRDLNINIKGEFLGHYPLYGTNNFAPLGYKWTWTGTGRLPIEAVDIKFTWADGHASAFSHTLLPEERYPTRELPIRDPQLNEDPTAAIPSQENQQHLPSKIDVVLHLSGTRYTPKIDTQGVPSSQ
jgi:hypothetical protein